MKEKTQIELIALQCIIIIFCGLGIHGFLNHDIERAAIFCFIALLVFTGHSCLRVLLKDDSPSHQK